MIISLPTMPNVFVGCIFLFHAILHHSNAQDFDGAWYTRASDLHRYFFTHNRMHWNDARNMCTSMDGYLLTIGSEGENTFLKTIPESGNHWIGLNGICDQSGCHSFNWQVDEGGYFQDWASNSPRSGSNVECVYKNFPAGTWYNSFCTHVQSRINAVCEFVDDCYPNNPCDEGLTCQSVANERGHTCAPLEEVDECSSNPCQNDGTCVDGLGSYTCICTKQWENRNCETLIYECTRGGNDCGYGQCEYVSTANKYLCVCDSGFHGGQCQFNIDDCVDNLCAHGKCVDGVQGYSCVCDDDYKGDLCEDEKGRSSLSTETALAIAIIVLLLLIVAVVISMAYRHFRSTGIHANNAYEAPRVRNISDNNCMNNGNNNRELPMIPENGNAFSQYEKPLPQAKPKRRDDKLDEYENV